MKPAIRIVFAPLFKRDKTVRDAGKYLHGTASGRTVTIDPRSSELLETFVHELIHIRHPGWPEAAVQEHTKRRMKKMSWRERAKLIQLLGSGKIEGEQ